MSFFEPDVLVETEDGLAESIGYRALADDELSFRHETQLLSIDELFSGERDRRPEIQAGLPITDVYREVYRSERKFTLRDKNSALIFNEGPLSKLVEVMFGAFPKEIEAHEFLRAYVDVFEPSCSDVRPEHWFDFFEAGAITPFVPTYRELEIIPRWGRDLSFFVFDHRSNADLIDYWNKRLFHSPVYPIPLCWISELAPTVTDMVNRNHRPIPNNPYGTKFHSELFIGRSIDREKAADLVSTYFSGCPKGSLFAGGVWHPVVRDNPRVQHQERHSISVKSASIDATLDAENTIRFDTLHPSFASRFGRGRNRWANVVNLRSHSSDHLALSYPTNLRDRRKPRLFLSLRERPIVSREGWVLCQGYTNSREWIHISDGSTAIAEWLEQKSIKANSSGAGRIARQLIDSLGSLWATHLIADEETMRLLEEMTRSESRTAPYNRWMQLVAKRSEIQLPRIALDDFTNRGLLRLGLEVKCANCTHSNWYGLDQLDYKLICERCQQLFDYPQGNNRTPWKYRVTGPFSVPRFAEGAYSVALTLSMFKQKLAGSTDTELTYSTGLELTHESFVREVDFAFWTGEGSTFGQRQEPRFLIGEAKSFADEAITTRDIESLKLVAAVIPGTTVVVSVLKSGFSENELLLLRDLVKWGWKQINGVMRAQTIILTGRELFSDHYVSSSWKEAGPPYDQFDDFHTFHDLDEFAFATQKVYAGLSYYDELTAQHS